MASAKPFEKRYFHNKRGHEDKSYFELYRCYDENQDVQFSARADRFGKPMKVFTNGKAVVEIVNRKNYLLNGRTDIQTMENKQMIGSYSRLGRVYDSNDQKAGRWRDARKWSEELKENLVDAVANVLLGSGDVPGGVNHSDIHLFSNGKEIIGMLQREKLPFFPDSPKSMKPHKLARLASKIIPGELGKSLGEVTPPYGWTLNVYKALQDENILPYSALVHLEYLRWARSA